MSESKELKIIITGTGLLRRIRIERAGLSNPTLVKILGEEGFAFDFRQRGPNPRLIATRPNVKGRAKSFVNEDFVANLGERLKNADAVLTLESEDSDDPWEFEWARGP